MRVACAALAAALLLPTAGLAAEPPPLSASLAAVPLDAGWPLAAFPALVLDARAFAAPEDLARAARLFPGALESLRETQQWPDVLGLDYADLDGILIHGWPRAEVMILSGGGSFEDGATIATAFGARGYLPSFGADPGAWERDAWDIDAAGWDEPADPFRIVRDEAAFVHWVPGRLAGSRSDDALDAVLAALAGEMGSLDDLQPVTAALRHLEAEGTYRRLLVDIPAFQRRSDVPPPQPGQSALPQFTILVALEAADGSSGRIALLYASAAEADLAHDVLRRRLAGWEFREASRYLPLPAAKDNRPDALGLDAGRSVLSQLGGTAIPARLDIEGAYPDGSALPLLLIEYGLPAPAPDGRETLRNAYFDGLFFALTHGDYAPLAIAGER